MVTIHAMDSGPEIVRGWQAVAEEALQLEYDGKERAAIETWRELFGWRMPRL